MARLEITEESLRAELDDILADLAAEVADCDPGDGWYPDTGDPRYPAGRSSVIRCPASVRACRPCRRGALRRGRTATASSSGLTSW